MRKTVNERIKRDESGKETHILECKWIHRVQAAGIIVPVEIRKILELNNSEFEFEAIKKQDEEFSSMIIERAEKIRELLEFLESLGFNQKS
jgi:bifunctional DNA-binding transcriptional regulator/antitoxin component of YhaV-PrlF toxin-antitoxin module